MSSDLGNNVKLSIFGESHSNDIGMVLSGIDAGEEIDNEYIRVFMNRRAPGRNSYSTARKEGDKPIFMSGIFENVTTGTPIAARIENSDTRSKDYSKIKDCPRPSHADYAAYERFGEAHDIRGGGHFSGRLTAPLCIAGAICKQILERKGIYIGAHISSIGSIADESYDSVNLDRESLLYPALKDFPVNDDKAGKAMVQEIERVKSFGDSIGGTVECGIIGLAPGVGDTIFSGIESRISQAVFGIPAVKGIEFGAGFESSRLLGSQNNDTFYYEENKVKTKTNNSGGILGGISDGMPITFNTAFKPTPSIEKEQDSVDLDKGKDTTLIIQGRHDPSIVPRAVPCIEAAAAVVILDLLKTERY